MSKDPETGIYRIYLLTVWKRDGDADCVRFLIEDPRSGARWGFVSIDRFIDGLLEISGLALPSIGQRDGSSAQSDDESSASFPGC